MLEAGESILPIDEIEKLLIARNALTGTHFYRAIYQPFGHPDCTISLLVAGEVAEVTLHIHGELLSIDYRIGQLTHEGDKVFNLAYPSEPKFIEEIAVIPLTLARIYDKKMQTIGAIDLRPPQEPQFVLDGMSVEANILYLNERQNRLSFYPLEDKYFWYSWNLVYLAMCAMQGKRTVKYLIVLTYWLMNG